MPNQVYTSYSDREDESLESYNDVFMVPNSQEYQKISMELLGRDRRQNNDGAHPPAIVENIVILEEAPQMQAKRDEATQNEEIARVTQREKVEREVDTEDMERKEVEVEKERVGNVKNESAKENHSLTELHNTLGVVLVNQARILDHIAILQATFNSLHLNLKATEPSHKNNDDPKDSEENLISAQDPPAINLVAPMLLDIVGLSYKEAGKKCKELGLKCPKKKDERIQVLEDFFGDS